MKSRSVFLTAALVASLCLPATAASRIDQGACSWPTTLDAINFAYPDTSADYWMTHFGAVPASKLVIRGRYPDVRYFSFHAYDEAQRPVASVADHEIEPATGTNPFVAGEGSGSYKVTVVFEPEPRNPKPNTIYAGTMETGGRNPAGWVIYRIYMPDNPRHRTGGVPLPDVTLVTADGAVDLPLESCAYEPPPVGQRFDDEIAKANYPFGRGDRHAPGTHSPPKWKRFYGTDREFRDWCKEYGQSCDEGPKTTSGFLANQQIAYLYARISREYGQVVVVRLKPPTFPDTRAGIEPHTERQVRYWSLCQNNDASQRVVECSADFETVIDNDGYATFVVSDPEDRPSVATRSNGINWLPWGGAYYSGILIYRHMLPSGNFDAAIQNIPEGTPPAVVMGAYHPEAAYCDKATIEKRGISHCFTSS